MTRPRCEAKSPIASPNKTSNTQNTSLATGSPVFKSNSKGYDTSGEYRYVARWNGLPPSAM